MQLPTTVFLITRMRSLLVISFGLFSFPLWAQDTIRLSLLFTGDIMQHDSNINTAYDAPLKKYDYSFCFEYMVPILSAPDLTIGNLELTLGGSPHKGYPQFSAPDALAVELKKIGFDILVTANNHSLDRRRKGVDRTIRVLDSLGIVHTGTFVDSISRAATYPLFVEKSGFRISLLNYTYGTNGIPVTKPNVVNYIDTVVMKADFDKARLQKPDIILVFMHWGFEYQSLPNAEQKRLTEFCFRNGVQLVIGAHPHVVQPMEWNKEKNQLVAYSLGNFISGQRPRYRDGGAMLWVDLMKVKSDSTAVTTINDASYELEWVEKSNGFVMRPFRYFEGDTLFLKDKMARDAKDLFVKDSRALFAKHNKNITERKANVSLDSIHYSIQIEPFPTADSTWLADPLVEFYGIDSVDVVNTPRRALVGNFPDYELAQQAMIDLSAKNVFRRVRIVRRVDREPVIVR